MSKVVIASQSLVLRDAIASSLQENWQVYTCTTSDSAIRTLRSLNPDALILDMTLPNSESFDVLVNCFPELPPLTIALSADVNIYMQRHIARWGVDYIFQVPCEPHMVAECLNSSHLFQNIALKQVAQHLRVLGFNAGFTGYFYLLLAIPFLRQDPSQHLHKEIYPKVANQLRSDPRAVERAIRSSIQNAWLSADHSAWQLYFPINAAGEIECPTNKSFIFTLTQRI